MLAHAWAVCKLYSGVHDLQCPCPAARPQEQSIFISMIFTIMAIIFIPVNVATLTRDQRQRTLLNVEYSSKCPQL